MSTAKPSPVKARRGNSSGYVVSAEVFLIALVLGLGMVTGWSKLRDQSLAEVNDTLAAIDAYIQGSQNIWNTGGTRWIKSSSIVEPGVLGDVNEGWGAGNTPYLLSSDPNSDGYYTDSASNGLVYRSAPTPSSDNTTAGEGGIK